MTFLWADIETTGLSPDVCSICEIALIVTDDDLVEKAVFHRVISVPNGSAWDLEAIKLHAESGLLHEISNGSSFDRVSKQVIDFLETNKPLVGQYKLAGSSVHFDRAFLIKHIPEFEKYLYNQQLDVSSIKLALKARNKKEAIKALDPMVMGVKHRALDDIRLSKSLLESYYNHNLLTVDDR